MGGGHQRRGRKRLGADEHLVLGLAAASQARERDADRLRGLAAAADPVALVALLQRCGLVGVLGQRLLELVPDHPARPDVRALIALARTQGERHLMVLDHVTGTLEGEGIPVVALKGPRFARAVHGDVGLRPSGDLDLLVAPDRLADAQLVLQELGYADRGDPVDARGLPLLHAAAVHPGGLPPIELHWRVHWYEERFAQDALARSTTTGVRSLTLADEFLTLLLYIARDALSGLRLTVDAVTWLEHHPTSAEAVGPLLEAYPQLRAGTSRALDLVAQIERLGRPGAAPAGHRERLAAGLADPLRRMPAKQALAERGLADILLAPRPMDAVWRQLLPRRGTARAWAERDPDGPGLGKVAAHVARSLRRYALAPALRATTPTRPPRA